MTEPELDEKDFAILRACLKRTTVERFDPERVRKLQGAGLLLCGSPPFIQNRSFETTTSGRAKIGEP